MGVAQTVAEWLEGRPRPINIFGGILVRRDRWAARALMIIIEWNLAHGTGKRHRQLSAWIHFAEEHVGDGIAGLAAAKPCLENGGGIRCHPIDREWPSIHELHGVRF